LAFLLTFFFFPKNTLHPKSKSPFFFVRFKLVKNKRLQEHQQNAEKNILLHECSINSNFAKPVNTRRIS